MYFRIQLIAILMSLGLIFTIFEFVRKRKLREEYSLLWLLAGLVLLVFSIDRDLVAQMSQFMGVSYAPSALFIVAFFFGLLLAIHFSLIVSQLTERVRILVQQNALLKLEVEQLQKQVTSDMLQQESTQGGK